MAESTIHITALNEGPVTTTVDVRGMKVDFFHGSEENISPVEYVLSALAGCINGVGYKVAEDMGFELKGITSDIWATIDPSRLLGQSNNVRAGLKEITLNLKPKADVDTETLKKWLENIEDRCPVNDIISNPTPVKITLA
jgi:uncharacterized OsmC-like protein